MSRDGDQMASRILTAVISGIFTILAALIGGYFLLVSTGNIDNPFKNPTPPPTLASKAGDTFTAREVGTAPTPTVAANVRSTVTIENLLQLPVNVLFNGQYVARIDRGGSLTIQYDYFPVDVTYEIIRDSRSAGGVWGEPVSGLFRQVAANSTITTSHVIGTWFYFYPKLTNNTDYECSIVINEGYTQEQQIGMLPAHSKGVAAGYYTWMAESNVTLHCSNGSVSWWGIRPGQSEPRVSLSKLVGKGGLTELVLNP